MKDRFALLLSGLVAAVLSGASWHWWGQDGTMMVMAVLLLACAVDNGMLRRQVRYLLAERERREKKGALRHLMGRLIALREKKGRD
ncbi:hypothetical protein SAMN05192549_110197 [Duganella sacchari]|uniref:Uncharacterized protein n=1 Tax=Duganella sacchari TaxID=551987 RepID=A0A1M7R5H4_9BURK|nr:hypothetical protein [Duganella sacchari]SHN40295.1 hypothetical protein SAMN05192549_110197 [Duganella sacchari]